MGNGGCFCFRAVLKFELPRCSMRLSLGFYCSLFPKTGAGFWSHTGRRSHVGEYIWGGNSWSRWALGWSPVDGRWDVRGREEGQTLISGPCQTRASHTLTPVVWLFSLAVSCSPSRLLPPHVPFVLLVVTAWVPLPLGFPAGSLLGQEPLAPSILPILQAGGWASWPPSPPPDFGLSLRRPHPEIFTPQNGSASVLSTSLEEVSRSREATTAPAAFPQWQEVTLLPAAGEHDITGGGGAGGVPGGGSYLVYSLWIWGQLCVTLPGFLGHTGCK